MKLARLFGIALTAFLAVSALLASTASAIPKFKLPITLRGFTALSLTSVLSSFASASESDVVICQHDVATGTIINDDEVFAKVHFLGCRAIFKNATEEKVCTAKGFIPGEPAQEEGLILTKLLRGLLGLLHQPNGAAGILFHANTGVVFVGIESPCTTETQVEGSLAGSFEPTGKLQNTAKINFVVTNKKQAITLILVLSGEVKSSLKAFGIATATEESEDNVKFEEAVEVD